ncbi:MAG: thioredoxin family protein [Saprospiraceae bacterium]|nr:thioredoxin family protein [Saprospiraceae bacterium]MCB0544135.1 thioredoxin family protein [Saprospiraceae bacterium]MCB9354050.1 thioredoxin family protein [Lewinellaceae bacterium]
MKSLVYAAFVLSGIILLASAPAPSGYIVGDKADDFSLKNSVDGKMVSLSDYQGVKGYIIVFTCNHCPYAQLYEQRIIDLHNKYNALGFPVIAINPNSPAIVEEDSYEEMQKRAKQKRYPFAYLFDEEQAVYPKFGATRTPHVFVLDSSRVVRYIGAIDDNPELPEIAKNHWVVSAVDALLRGDKPATEFTRAIGCTVKKKP